MNSYHSHSSKNYVKNPGEREYYRDRATKWVREDFKNEKMKHPGALLLDSSLISPTQYDYKIIECGKYYQVYKYENIKESKKDKKDKTLLDYDYLFTKRESIHSNDLKYVVKKNIMRSKFQLERIVKCNEDKFKTFITLTFADNVTSITEANKKFDIWRTKMKSIYKDFCYVGVPEFQKRGAVHYHLMTNIEINKEYSYIRRGKVTKATLIVPQKEFSEKQLQKMSKKQREHCYDVKYWSYGNTSVYPLQNMNVVGYLVKYFTKDIDNRLWGKRKYLYSMNLKRPKEILINSSRISEYSHLFLIENLYDKVYSKMYYDKLENEIQFTEYKLEV